MLDQEFVPNFEEKERALKNARETTLLQPMIEYIDANKITKERHEKLLVIIEAVKSCNRPDNPLLWFSSLFDFDCVNDDREAIKGWIRGQKKFARRDLITDNNCVAGIESDFVIFLGADAGNAAMSRCKGQFVHIR